MNVVPGIEALLALTYQQLYIFHTSFSLRLQLPLILGFFR